MPVSVTRLVATGLLALLICGCAPRPDADNALEMARVFGECSFKLNTTALGLEPLDQDDPRVEVIDNVVQHLLATRYIQFPWQVHTTVFDHPVPNAFTTGGGFLAAFSGVYAMAENEAALAGIIAHELSHMDKRDPMEIANYLEVMLASRLADGGVEDYDTGQALQTVVDFCLAIPGLVSWQWQKDMNKETSDQFHSVYNDHDLAMIPFTFSEDPESPYSPESRDPQQLALNSSCNNKSRQAYDEFVVINPESYLTEFPDAESLPPVPDGIGGSIGGLPGAETLWAIDPWLAFQHTAFARYAECQADEGGILNLFASGYNPLALNQAFAAILWLFQPDEKAIDWRFQNHPSLAQRIEDNRDYINNNGNYLPGTDAIENDPDRYADYILMANQIDEFTSLRDNARDQLFSAGASSFSGEADLQQALEYEPITVVDLAVMLHDALSGSKASTPQPTASLSRCDRFKSVYEKVTGQKAHYCFNQF